MSNSENMDKQPLSVADLGVALPPTSGALSAADRAGLVNVLKDKLQLLAGMPSGYLESLPAKVKRRVSVLQELQAEHDELEAKFFEEKAALEAKYQKLYEPLYVKRADIVNGVVEVEPAKDEAPEAAEPAEEGKVEVKGVPEFWLTAMKTHEILGMQITDRDEGALKFIKDIKCSSLDEPTVNKGFKLDFYFEENPYFKNAVLSKTYHMIDDNEPILEKAVGTEIEWNAGKNLTQKVMKKKAKKGSKNTKPVTKTENCDSFFNFFNPPQVPEDDQDIDQEMVEQLQDLLEQDYDVGSTIRDKIIPHAVSWFTGEALQGEDFEDDDEEGDDDDDDDDDDEDDYDEDQDDEEDDEDEEDDDEEEVRGRKRVVPTRKGGASKASDGQQQSVEQPPECKQQ